MRDEKIREILVELFGQEQGEEAAEQLTRLLKLRSDKLQPGLGPQLTQSSCMLITYADMFASGGLDSLTSFIRERLTGVVDLVHLLPFFPWSSDDGFSVIDYTGVAQEVGTWEDVEQLGELVHPAFDLVLNHISSRSAWFQGYLAGEPEFADFFIEMDPATDLSAVIRPRALPLLSEYETSRGLRHVWTTFSRDQIDLNYRNPRVLLAMIEVILEYVARGAGILRLDAIGFLWKEVGTGCMHLRGTHLVLKLIRRVVDLLPRRVLLLSETNVPHRENVSYFGEGDEAGMVYQFPLPPLVAAALLTRDPGPLGTWARSLEPETRGCYLNFLASHDGVGMRPAFDLLPADHIRALLENTLANGGRVATRHTPEGERPYELNINYLDLVCPPDRSDEERLARFLLAHSILLTMPGVPGIYFHSLVGSRSWHKGMEQTGRPRTINRERPERGELESELDDPTSLRARVFSGITGMIRVRALSPAFHPDAGVSFPDLGPGIFTVTRTWANQTVYAVHNLGTEPALIPQHTENTRKLSGSGILDSRGCLIPALGWVWLESAH